MIPLAEVLRRHWPAYEHKYGPRLLPSHRRAVQAVMSCRTPALGGQLYTCTCGQRHYAWHSCNHRACPQCGHSDATEWLERQRRKLLPVPHYLITFTVPAELRSTIRANQKALYPMLLQEGAGALRDVAREHKDLGAEIGLLAVLQTWTRDLRYHPHVHCVVPAGGLSADRLRWISPKREGYFLPQAVLAMRFRNRLRAVLQKAHPELLRGLGAQVWSRKWVADVQPVGSGEPALKYLAAYVYRTAFSAERIVSDDGQYIAFTYKDSKIGQRRTVRLTAERFLHRFLQHVLPKGLQRIRYFGLMSAAAKTQWLRVCALLDWKAPVLNGSILPLWPVCPHCHQPMKLIGLLPRAPPCLR